MLYSILLSLIDCYFLGNSELSSSSPSLPKVENRGSCFISFPALRRSQYKVFSSSFFTPSGLSPHLPLFSFFTNSRWNHVAMAVAFEADIYLLESLQEDGVVLNKFVTFH